MDTELLNYINQLIAGNVGIVWVDAQKPFLTLIDELLEFIDSELHESNAIINSEKLSFHWETLNPDIKVKKRFFYLNKIDFNNLDADIINLDEYAFVSFKTINETIILQDDFVKPNEYYFCTTDEFEILKSIKR